MNTFDRKKRWKFVEPTTFFARRRVIFDFSSIIFTLSAKRSKRKPVRSAAFGVILRITIWIHYRLFKRAERSKVSSIRTSCVNIYFLCTKSRKRSNFGYYNVEHEPETRRIRTKKSVFWHLDYIFKIAFTLVPRVVDDILNINLILIGGAWGRGERRGDRGSRDYLNFLSLSLSYITYHHQVTFQQTTRSRWLDLNQILKCYGAQWLS